MLSFGNSWGWIVSLIAGIIIAIILKQPVSTSTLIYPVIILVVAFVGVLIGFYIDYQAAYEYRDEEPVLMGCLVTNVITIVGGTLLTICFIIIGGI